MSWYVASTVNAVPNIDLFVYINNESIVINGVTINATVIGSANNNQYQYIIPYYLIEDFSVLDYVLVGGGGGGGHAHDGSGANSNYSGGGGGSGQIALTFDNKDYTDNQFTYNINGIGTTNTFLPLNSNSSLTINIGFGGQPGQNDNSDAGDNGFDGVESSILYNGSTIVSAAPGTFGWGGDQSGDNGDNGDGGGGYNTGGGGYGDGTNGSSPTSSQSTLGGAQGYTGGNGGGNGAGTCNTSADNAGGGGAAGTAVTYTGGVTGGNGGYSNDSDPSSDGTAAVQFTGAGGGGGSYAHQNWGNPTNGGCGYAILWFHN